MLVNIFLPLFKYRYLLQQLVLKDINSKFRRSSLGVAWMIVSPLLLLAGYTIVFGVFLKSRWGGAGNSIEFALVLYAGLIFYNFFSEVIGRSPGLIYSNQPYVKKMIFPLEVLSWSVILSATINFIMSFFVWSVFCLVVKNSIPLTALWLPVIFIPFLLFTLGCSWLLSGYAVFHSDVEHVIPIVLMLMMFVSPLFFSVEGLPEAFRNIVMYNPMTYILEEGRGILITGRPPKTDVLIISYIISLLIAWLGHASFMGNRKGFADAI